MGKPAIVMFALAALVLSACDQPVPTSPARFDVNELLKSKQDGFKQVKGERAFYFPKDHGPHMDYRQEWWYLSGNLKSDEGDREFGFQMSFFRMATTAKPVSRQSRWGARNIYMAHFAITDINNGKFHAFERLAREAHGLSGARLFPFRIWVEDWQLYSSEENEWPWHLVAQQHDVGISLHLEQGKPLILQGEKGLYIRSGSGDASYYYSLPRMESKGHIYIGDEKIAVTGKAWLDREWSSSALAKHQRGWDWFALQLNDKTEIMYYALRNKDGGTDPMSQGVFIDYNSEKKVLTQNDVKISVLKTWSSPHGKHYPARWKMSIKKINKSFEIIPMVENQELPLSVHYWEGAVKVMDENRELGRGYVELVGY